MRQSQASDTNKLKWLTVALASSFGVQLMPDQTSKSERGFNNDGLGRMLIPVDFIQSYNEDPMACVLKVFGFQLSIHLQCQGVGEHWGCNLPSDGPTIADVLIRGSKQV